MGECNKVYHLRIALCVWLETFATEVCPTFHANGNACPPNAAVNFLSPSVDSITKYLPLPTGPLSSFTPLPQYTNVHQCA